MKILKGIAITSASMLALCIPAAGSAQVSNTASSPATEDQSSADIIVTAQKREQNLQDVPVSVAVLSTAALENNRVTGIEQLSLVAPSVNFTNSANTRGQGVSIRGIGTLNFSDGVEPSVSTIVDGVVIGRSAGTFFDFNDIERVEVLRGPQGTLFGKNASAGALNIVTEKPSLTKSGLSASVSYGTYDDWRIKGSGSLVLDEGRAAVRLSGYRSKADGIITNLYNGENLNNIDSWGLRGKLLFEPSSVTSIYIIGDYSENNRDCCVSTARSVLPGTTYFNGQTRASLLAGQTLGPFNREVSIDGEFFNRQKSGGVSVELNTELGGQTVTSITAYREFKVYDNNDADGVSIDALNVNNARQRQKQFTQELRLTSPANEPIEYVLGLFYFWQNVRTKTQVRGTGLTALPAGQYVGNEVNRSINTNNVAAFGQLTGHLTDRFSLIGGFRLTAEDMRAEFARTLLAGAVGSPPFLGGPPYTSPTLKASNTDFSYRLGAQYEFSPDVMAYATYTRGYKGPAINMLNNLSPTIVNSGQAILNPEIAKSWEAGLRTTLLDRMMTFNITGFHTTFNDFQAQTFNAILNSFTLSNAGKLTTRGVEVETVLRPAPGFTLSGNGAYTDTKVEGLIIGCYPGQTAALGCVGGRQDVTGSSLANAPKWAFSVSANYGTDIGDTLRATANMTFTYRSEVFFAYRDPNTVQEGYGLLNGSLGIETQDGRYRLSVFGKNLTNKHFATNITTGFLDTSPTGAGYVQLLTTDAYRTVGVEAAVKF